MVTKSSEPRATRDLLLGAAQELYAENGVAATTPRQVLSRSGVGQGSLYHHFPSKRDLALTAVSRTVAQTLESARAILASDADPRDRLKEYLGKDRDAVAGCRVGRLTADSFVMADESLQQPLSAYFEDLTEMVTALFVAEGLDTAAAADRATAAVAVIQGGYVLSRAAGNVDPMRRAVRGFLALVEGQR